MYDEAYLTELHIEYCTQKANENWNLVLKFNKAENYFTNGLMWNYYNEILRFWSIMYGTHGC